MALGQKTNARQDAALSAAPDAGRSHMLPFAPRKLESGEIAGTEWRTA